MKTKFFKFLTLVALSIGFPVLTGCDKDTPEPGKESGSDFVIEQQYLNLSVDKEGKSIEIPVLTNIPNAQWYITNSESWIIVSKTGPKDGQGTVSLTVRANTTGDVRTAAVKISSSTKDYTISIKQWADSELHVEGDFPVKVVSATATNYQAGSGEVRFCYDDDVNTLFHSNWNKPNTWPFELTFNFKGDEEIDYVEYIPRVGGGNGCIGEFELFIAETKGAWEKVGDYNFNMASQPGRVVLPSGKKPVAVKFSITSGLGGFVSCAEMRFMRYNTGSELDSQLLSVFTDLTCSELLPGVTDSQIQMLDPVFQRIAEALRDGAYDPLEKSFRIHEYNAYSNPTEWNDRLMTKIYSNWDNPMGIAVKKGEKVLILVGDTHGNNLSVQIVGEQGTTAENNVRPQNQGTFHSLRPGVNQIEADQEGQLFLMYTALPSAPTSKPIKVHIPLGQGTFAGYWSLAEHKTDEKFVEILGRAQHKYFAIVGDRMILYFKRSLLKRKIVDAITQWDNIITWQQNFMGIEEYRPAQWNNHIAGVSMEKECGYMWASNWVMGFVDSKINSEDIMGLANFNKNADNAWGPAHEMGHVNQAAINWASTTESSNNLFSNYVLTRFGRYNSRGSGLYYRFESVYANGHSWASMNNGISDGPEIPKKADGEYFDEDTAIHMRMNWQLWNYYHRVLGDEKFFGRVFQKMREVGLDETENCGQKQLEFAVACSEAAGEDLTDFFEAWGFFRAHNSTISQYGTYPYRVTTDMINKAKARMAAYPKPKHALEYIEDRDASAGAKPGDFQWDQIGDMGFYAAYQNNAKVASNASATVSGRTVTTSNCNNAVAIEIRVKKGSEYGEIRYASNFYTFTVPSKVNVTGCAAYAVQADGTRIFLANM